MRKPTLDEVQKVLSNFEVNITFTKKSDGSTRHMRCTTNSKLFEGQAARGFGQKNSTQNVPVIDLDLRAWRSFNYDTMTAFEVVQHPEFSWRESAT